MNLGGQQRYSSAGKWAAGAAATAAARCISKEARGACSGHQQASAYSPAFGRDSRWCADRGVQLGRPQTLTLSCLGRPPTCSWATPSHRQAGCRGQQAHLVPPSRTLSALLCPRLLVPCTRAEEGLLQPRLQRRTGAEGQGLAAWGSAGGEVESLCQQGCAAAASLRWVLALCVTEPVSSLTLLHRATVTVLYCKRIG